MCARSLPRLPQVVPEFRLRLAPLVPGFAGACHGDTAAGKRAVSLSRELCGAGLTCKVHYGHVRIASRRRRPYGVVAGGQERDAALLPPTAPRVIVLNRHVYDALVS